MSKTLIIAEKPSVATDLARVLGKLQLGYPDRPHVGLTRQDTFGRFNVVHSGLVSSQSWGTQ